MGNIIRADWSYKNENATFSKPTKLSSKSKKKIAKRALVRKCHSARRQARSIIGNLTTGRSNRDYANALFAIGQIPGGPFGKKGAMSALVAWYESVPVSEHVKKVKKRISGKAFYDSDEWRKLRYKVFQKHGRQCLCCGAKPPQVVLHVDHVKPRSLHPELELDINNLQILCEDCNMGKSNLDTTDFRRKK